MTDNDLINELLQENQELKEHIEQLLCIIEELEHMERLKHEKTTRKRH